MKKIPSEKMVCLFLSFIFIFVPVSLFAKKSIASIQSKTQSPLTYRILENGMISLRDDVHEVVKIDPEVFTGIWFWHSFGLLVDDQKHSGIRGVCQLPDGNAVDLTLTVWPVDHGLKIHYTYVPRKTFEACSVRIPLYFPYEDWIGVPYRLGEQKGHLPLTQVGEDTSFGKADSASFSMGPSAILDGLTVKVEHIRCHLTLMDDRKWTSNLVVAITHGEPMHQGWTWNAGEEKDFDIVLTFNREVVAQKQTAEEPQNSFAGSWHGLFEKGTQYENGRISASIIRNHNGKYRAHFNFDDGFLSFYSNSNPDVTIHQNSLKATYADGNYLEMELDPTKASVTGSINAWKHVGPFSMVRGRDFLVPRLDDHQNPVTVYRYQAPEDLKDGLSVGDLKTNDEAFSSISAALNDVLNENLPDIHSLLIIHKGKLLVDEYFYGYGSREAHPLFSVTKSVFSTLFGIAQDRGLINVDQKLYDLYPEYRSKAGWNPRKNDVTVGMLLAMDSGFACDNLADSCGFGIYTSPDWVDYTLSLPLNNLPGNHWVYNGTSLIPLSNWITRRSGLSLADFAQKYLYDPLGIKSYPWETGPNGVARVDANYWLTPREMAKLGLLYLDHGKWNGKQVISEKWVTEATSSETAREPRDFDYGYLWWIKNGVHDNKPIRIIEANGWGGQYIFIVPDRSLVCVMTAGNYKMGGLMNMEEDFFKKYILSAF
jgi:CubicO group peptidase (beta-lactamase class C family)